MALSPMLLGKTTQMDEPPETESSLKLHRNRAGIDALALDPQDDSKVYMALGEYTNR